MICEGLSCTKLESFHKMPPKSRYAKYKHAVRNYLFYKCGWDRSKALKWLNENQDFLRAMFATEASWATTAKLIDDMEKKVNGEEAMETIQTQCEENTSQDV